MKQQRIKLDSERAGVAEAQTDAAVGIGYFRNRLPAEFPDEPDRPARGR